MTAKQSSASLPEALYALAESIIPRSTVNIPPPQKPSKTASQPASEKDK